MDSHFNTYWSRIVALLGDTSVDELLINGDRSATLVSGRKTVLIESPFPNRKTMLSWLIDFARAEGVRLDPLCGSAGGMVSAPLLEVLFTNCRQLRWHALLPPLSQDGPLLALRRHRLGGISLDDFAGDDALKERLISAVSQRRSLVIAGPTGCGKSTLLVALLAAFAAQERVIIMESITEIPALFPGWVRLLERIPNLEGVGAVSLNRLLQESLRLRPDRLVLGEIRSSEAQAFLNALMTGHDGGMATMHAGSLGEARKRLVALCEGRFYPPDLGVGSEGDMSLPVFDLVLLRRGDKPQICAFEGALS